MDTIIGLQGGSWVLVASDMYAMQSIVRMSHTERKALNLDHNKVLALAGPVGDRNQFGQYVQKNIHLYRLRNDVHTTTHAAANFTRSQLAHFLRKNPYQVNLLLAGYDPEGPSLYWIDYLASMTKVRKGAHGYGSFFIMGLLDRWYKEDMSVEEGIDLLRKCKNELVLRFMVSQSNFLVKVIDKDGVREIQI